MVEKIIFSILSIAIFMLTFFKLIKKNDTSYIYILLLEFIGIVIYFMELFFTFILPIWLKIIVYLFAIILFRRPPQWQTPINRHTLCQIVQSSRRFILVAVYLSVWQN